MPDDLVDEITKCVAHRPQPTLTTSRAIEGGADELPLRARNLAALRPRWGEPLHAVAESLAPEVELTDQLFPRLIARSPAVGDEAPDRATLGWVSRPGPNFTPPTSISARQAATSGAASCAAVELAGVTAKCGAAEISYGCHDKKGCRKDGVHDDNYRREITPPGPR